MPDETEHPSPWRDAELPPRQSAPPIDDVEQADTLPRVRVKPIGGAVSGLTPDVDKWLADVYDPDRIARSFYKPMREWTGLYFVPWRQCDAPGSVHRLQYVSDMHEGVPVISQMQARGAQRLKDFSESMEYRRSRWYETTGEWTGDDGPDPGEWKRLRESVDPTALGPREDRDAKREAQRELVAKLRESANGNAAEVDRILREAGVEGFDGINTSSAEDPMADIDQEFIPITGGPYFKQQYLYAHWEAQSIAFWEKNHNELARAAITITTDFSLGRGIAWKIKNDRVFDVWDEFWVRNDMERRLRVMCDDLTWSGELMIRKDVPLKGFLRVRCMDPGSFMEIVTDPIDVEQVLFYHASYPSPYNMPYTEFRGHQVNTVMQRYVIAQFPPNEIHHVKLNVSATEKWGRSDFYAAFGTLKRHRDWVNAETLRGMLQANMVWKIRLTGDDADVQAFLSDPNNTKLPPFGSVWVENSALTLEAMHEDVGQQARFGQGTMGSFLQALFATSQAMPVTYFNIQGPGQARATALKQGEPFSKKIAARQQVFRQILDHLFEECMKEAVRAGRIDPRLLRSADADPEWIFPGIYEEDRNSLFSSLKLAYDEAAIAHRSMATKMASELGFDSYDYDEEQKLVAGNAENPILAKLPPHAAAEQQQAGPAPGTPGVDVPGAPTPQQPRQPEVTGDNEQPEGRTERIAGADQRDDFRKQQLDRPQESANEFHRKLKRELGQQPSLLSEADKRFLEAAVRAGTAGVVRLPSGRKARIDA